MKLFNVTFNVDDKATTLVPRIPYSAGNGENKTIPRVCLADSIEHCLQAIPSDSRDVRKGARFRVREVEVSGFDTRLLYPQILKADSYVPDALENNEYWYLGDIECKQYLCKIVSFECEFCLAMSCITKEQCLEAISKYESTKGFEKYETSQEVYNAFTSYCNSQQKYEQFDDFWEDLAMLPWAQKTAIQNLQVKYIEEY